MLAGYDEREGIYRSKISMFRSRDVKFNEQLFVTKENKSEVIEEEFNNSTNLMSDTEDQIEDQVEDQVDEKTDDQVDDQVGDHVDDQIETQNENQDIIREPRRSSRIRKPVDRLEVNPKNKIYLTNDLESDLSDPQDINETLRSLNREKWKQAIQLELESIRKK